MKDLFKTTREERRIIRRLDTNQIEEWAKNRAFWKIYRDIIKATKEELTQSKPRGKQDGRS